MENFNWISFIIIRVNMLTIFARKKFSGNTGMLKYSFFLETSTEPGDNLIMGFMSLMRTYKKVCKTEKLVGKK